MLRAKVIGDRGCFAVLAKREKGHLADGLDATGVAIRRRSVDSRRETSPTSAHEAGLVSRPSLTRPDRPGSQDRRLQAEWVGNRSKTVNCISLCRKI